MNRLSGVEYFFTARDAYRTENLCRTDLSLNYSHRLGLGKAEIVFRGTLLNAFNRLELTNTTDVDCGVGGCISTAVLNNRNDASIPRFNPFTETPVEGVHWRKGATFGQPTSRFAYQTPRTWGFSVGLRF